ncbi:MAG: metallophosphoesterase family protein [Candidatus Bathyarchaeia archaeon]
MDFSAVIKESLVVQADDFTQTVKDATEVLCSEEGRLGNQTVTGRLVTLEPVGDAVVVGDLHGDLDSLVTILKTSDSVNRMTQSKDAALVFLGDYVDRGDRSVELFYAVLKLKLTFQAQVVLLRGNHEGPSDLLASPHDLPKQMRRKFGGRWMAIYSKVRGFFDCLYNAVYVPERYLMVHGGVPAKVRNLEELSQAHLLHPGKSYLEELLWSDPDEFVEGAFPSPRGAGYVFGRTVTEDVLNRLNVRVLIRGHEPTAEGYMMGHGGRILTLFSRRGEPYFNTFGAYLDMPLAERFESANQLLPYVHKF